MVVILAWESAQEGTEYSENKMLSNVVICFCFCFCKTYVFCLGAPRVLLGGPKGVVVGLHSIVIYEILLLS